MNTYEALIRTIIDHPDEDTPRLVYADFLDENGENERAEFIRKQIETGTSVLSDRIPVQQKMFREHLLGNASYKWRRGFAECCICRLDHWLWTGSIALLGNPITGVEIIDKSAGRWDEFYFGGFYFWRLDRNQANYGDDLPDCVFDLLKPYSQEICFIGSNRYALFQNHSDAQNALNLAAFKYVKEKAK